MSHNFDAFVSDLKQWDLELNEKQIQQFSDYYDLLVEWNSFMNLTAITEFDEVCKKHFLDSLSIVKAYDRNFLEKENLSLIDIGTGAGFPGIPIKIAFPNIHVTLLDSLNKRIKFLDTVIEKLAFANCETYHGRAEDYAKPNLLREKYDLCVSRAVANLSTLSEYCLPYVKIGGDFVSYKSEKISEESVQAEKAISILGGKVNRQVDFTLPESDIYRNIYIISKEKPTPKKFPRKAGLPSKEPL
ncbi:MAG: 16S rRNA (guanine(527)-N(7))-methyltransferase RsmG [Lachnospiraceae bacterium]|nr:16S rRNA (guanine(527)-N(7))-methyltransferase RsmG [Lachnospiraceae bacterium]